MQISLIISLYWRDNEQLLGRKLEFVGWRTREKNSLQKRVLEIYRSLAEYWSRYTWERTIQVFKVVEYRIDSNRTQHSHRNVNIIVCVLIAWVESSCNIRVLIRILRMGITLVVGLSYSWPKAALNMPRQSLKTSLKNIQLIICTLTAYPNQILIKWMPQNPETISIKFTVCGNKKIRKMWPIAIIKLIQ